LIVLQVLLPTDLLFVFCCLHTTGNKYDFEFCYYRFGLGSTFMLAGQLCLLYMARITR